MMLSHWPCFTSKFFMIWFHKILKLIFQKQPSCPRNICTGHWRKPPIFTAFFSNFYFDLVLPSYFLKWNRYFSASKNFPNSPCYFGKRKSILLQILHQSSVPLGITLLYFFKEPIKVQFFETFECSGQNSWNCGVNFETTNQFLLKFCIILHCHDT